MFRKYFIIYKKNLMNVPSLPENRRKPTELPMEIIPSQNLSVYTDEITLSEIRSVYTDENIPSVYTDRISDDLYSLFGKMQRCGDVEFFQTILPMEWPRDSNRDSPTVTWHFHQRNHRWNHRRIHSVGNSIGKSHYIPTPSAKTFVSPSFSFPSHLSPPKLQPTTHPNSPLFSTQALKFLILLYVVTISVSCVFYHFL